MTILHFAAERGHRDTVQLLLDQGGNISERDIWGHTALYCAANWGP